MSQEHGIMRTNHGTIIDRRHENSDKSRVNRGRFTTRERTAIKREVDKIVNNSRKVKDIDKGAEVTISTGGISEPQFRIHPKSGDWDRVFPGNKEFIKGDAIKRPDGGAGNGGGGSPDGESEDDFTFTLTREEFLDIFFEDLALPNMVKKVLAESEEETTKRGGFTTSGIPSNLDAIRTVRKGIMRRIAAKGATQEEIDEKERQLKELRDQKGDDDPEVETLVAEIESLRRRFVVWYDDHDQMFHDRVTVPKPVTKAVMFCLMDVSGSMDEEKKDIAKRFFMLLYLFLSKNYEKIDVVFIRHHTEAQEVDEETFFYARESGGTIVSTCLELTKKIIEERYASSEWNAYCAQASDGDNWMNDSPLCRDILIGQLLSLVQYFAYVEIAEEGQNLWEAYEEVKGSAEVGKFAMRRIESREDIFPVFHELFKKEGVGS